MRLAVSIGISPRQSLASRAELAGELEAVLGLGAGGSAVFGLGWRPARLARVEAAIRFFQAVLPGEEAEWEGRRYRLPHAPGPVPVWLGGGRRERLRVLRDQVLPVALR